MGACPACGGPGDGDLEDSRRGIEEFLETGRWESTDNESVGACPAGVGEKAPTLLPGIVEEVAARAPALLELATEAERFGHSISENSGKML